MHSLLNDDPDLRIYQQTGRVMAKTLEPVDQLLLILPDRAPTDVWEALPQGRRLYQAARRRSADSVPGVISRLDNDRQTLVIGGQIAATSTAFEQLSLGRRLAAAALDEKPGCVGICVHGFPADEQASIVRHVLAAVLAAGYRMPAYKKVAGRRNINSVRLVGLEERLDVSRVEAEAGGNNLARWLATMPPNKLDAESYADIVKGLAKDHDWQFHRYDGDELGKLGAGAFLAVAQGNEDDSASIIRLRYRPENIEAGPRLSLVGKGIIFDTGGTNLKPFQSMLDMHGDMQGSAVALGTLLAISELGLPLSVDCWLAVTENRTGPRAYKSQDVVTAANGKSIQVIHTDAEGRMALADALVLASRDEPELIVDYATLTGACVTAITKRYSGIFTNREDWHPRLRRAGRRCGERVWPFPSGGEFAEELKSDVADIMQCTIKGHGDHILAATFLGEFIENDVPWVHIDLSAADNDGGLGAIPTKVTGFGVRYTMSLLLDEGLLEISGP